MKAKTFLVLDVNDWIMIDNALKERDLTRHHLAQALGISLPTLKRLLTGDRPIKESEVGKIKEFIGVKLEITPSKKYSQGGALWH